MNKRDLSVEELGISRFRYRELMYFCLQYEEMKERLAELTLVSAVRPGHGGRGGGRSDPAARAALRLAELRGKLEAIEQAALEAGGDLYAYLLAAVTTDAAYEQLKVPCGRRQFYAMRRRFFLSLDKTGHTI